MNISDFLLYTLYWVIFMILIVRRKIVIFAIFSVLLSVSLLILQSKDSDVFSGTPTKRIVIDAGHGLPDGGAIGASGTIESSLNIKIAKRVEKLLKKNGFTVIMTRSDENTIAESGKTISEKKRNDMHRRLEIINNSNADLFVSIHMNKFTDSRYRGAQVIYSGNFIESEKLAQLIQKQFSAIPDNKSHRTCLKAPSSIFLLKNATIPAVIAECGFLSNYEEEQLLNTEKYQKELAEAIAAGIQKYYEFEGRNDA